MLDRAIPEEIAKPIKNFIENVKDSPNLEGCLIKTSVNGECLTIFISGVVEAIADYRQIHHERLLTVLGAQLLYVNERPSEVFENNQILEAVYNIAPVKEEISEDIDPEFYNVNSEF